MLWINPEHPADSRPSDLVKRYFRGFAHGISGMANTFKTVRRKAA